MKRKRRRKPMIAVTATSADGPVVMTTAMKQRQRFKRTKKIGDVTVTIPCFGKSRSRSR